MQNERLPRSHFLFPPTSKSKLLAFPEIKNDLAQPDHFPLSRDDRKYNAYVLY